MNELDTLKSFRAERDSEPPGAKEAIWRSLEARIEAASELASPSRSRPATAKPGLLSRRRRLLAFSGAVAVAAIVAGSLVLHDGPTAQPASAAEILHRTANAAAASDAPTSLIPGPGQFLYRKEQRLEVMGWLYPLPAGIPDRPLSTGGGTMSGPGTFNALLPTTVERWTAPDGGGRIREVAGTPKFWSSDEEAAWKAAGSPLPPPFSAEYQQRFGSGIGSEPNEVGPGVFDVDHKGFGNYSFPDTSGLPTEPMALRHAVESNTIKVSGFNLMFPKGHALNAEQTKEELLNVLFEGSPSPQLGAAIFDALAEVPGVKVETGATDSLGRHGDMLTSAVKDGLRTEYLFDPTTGQELGSREVLVDPTASSTFGAVPAGTTVSEQDVLGSGVVDSTGETAEAAS
jgi:hypothetical protein